MKKKLYKFKDMTISNAVTYISVEILGVLTLGKNYLLLMEIMEENYRRRY